jgi:hypothetical protein
MTSAIRTLSFAAGLFAAVVFSVSCARGAVIFSGVNFDVQVSNPVEVGVTPLEAITISVVGKNGLLPSAFDGTRLGGTGITSTGNALHQIWEFGALATPTLTLAVGGIPQNLDSHFLVTNDKIIAQTAPNENRIALSTAENAYGGFGNSLNGVFSLTGSTFSSTWDLAYLVVPQGSQLNFNFTVANAGSIKEQISASYVVTPEPGMMALLAAGCAGMLMLFRRRQ